MLSCAILDKLLPHQASHVNLMVAAVEKHGIAVDLSDTGTGKTYTSLAIAKHLALNVFIVCPKAIISKWVEVCEIFGVNSLGVVNYETIKNGKYYPLSDANNISYREVCPYITINRMPMTDSFDRPIKNKNGVQKTCLGNIQWHIPANTLVIFDEAHRGKNGVAARKKSETSEFMSTIKTALPHPHLEADAFPSTKLSQSTRVFGLFLSATITDRIECLDMITFLLGFYVPYNNRQYENYLRKLALKTKALNFTSDLQTINHILIPEYGGRMLIDAIVNITNDVKAKTYEVSAEISAAIEESYQELKAAMNAIRELGESDGIGKIIRCWQKIEVLKTPAAAVLINKKVAQGYAVVVFINFTETRNLLINHLASTIKYDFIHGGQQLDERDSIVRNFQDNTLDLLICNIRSGGVGISLHDLLNKPRFSIVYPTWDTIIFKQALGRIYRVDSKSNTKQRIFYCTSSVEQMLCDCINDKLKNIELLNNGDLLNYQQV